MRDCTVFFDSRGDITKVITKPVEVYAATKGYTISWGRDSTGGQLAKDGRYTSFVIAALED